MSLDWNKAFDRMMSAHGLSAKWLSDESGVSEVTISRFRKGKQPMTTDNLGKLLSFVPHEAQQYFFKVLIGQILNPRLSMEEMVESMSPSEVSAVLSAIAARLSSKPSKFADEKDLQLQV